MKIGILDESVIKKIATDILVDRPEVISVFVEGTELIIKSTGINSLVEYLEKTHGLHLVVNGDSYMIASQMNEGLAQDAANAGARAADIASKGLVSKTQEFVGKKQEEAGIEPEESDTDAGQAVMAKKKARDIAQGGQVATRNASEKALLALTKLNEVGTLDLNSPAIQKIIKNDRDFFVKLANNSDEDNISDEEDNNGVGTDVNTDSLKDKITDALKEE